MQKEGWERLGVFVEADKEFYYYCHNTTKTREHIRNNEYEKAEIQIWAALQVVKNHKYRQKLIQLREIVEYESNENEKCR